MDSVLVFCFVFVSVVSFVGCSMHVVFLFFTSFLLSVEPMGTHLFVRKFSSSLKFGDPNLP